MKTAVRSIIFIAIVLALSIYAGFAAIKNANAPAAWIAIAGLACVVLVYAVEFLNWKIGGNHITVEKLQSKVEVLEENVLNEKKRSEALAKALILVQEAGSKLGGGTNQHDALLAEYLLPWFKGLNESFIKETLQEIRSRTSVKADVASPDC